MTQLTIRKATVDDAEELCRLINEIIEAGGTTALQDPFSPEILADWFISGEFAIVCHVAQAGSGLTGFQFLSRYGDLPEGWADIGTFARQSPKISGVGTALFAATLSAAEERNIDVINATIRADNAGGLAYYEKMGFRTYNTLEKVPLNDGTPVDRIQKQYQVSKDKSGL
ncbi:L-amino acid N-acyltransferase YncA [Rhizobium sp. BK377]|nr:L-amino acid N-acyltransferase YncA [Rhizobium sp. BK377]